MAVKSSTSSMSGIKRGRDHTEKLRPSTFAMRLPMQMTGLFAARKACKAVVL